MDTLDVQKIVLPNLDGKFKWFGVEERINHEGESYAFVWSRGRTHPGDTISDLRWSFQRSARKPAYQFAVAARNKTGVKDWLLHDKRLPVASQGGVVIYPPELIRMPITRGVISTDSITATTITITPQEEPMEQLTNRERRIIAAQRRIEQEQERLDRLLSMPGEPEVEDGEPNVIWFEKTFTRSGVSYTYAAVRTSQGLWSTTGPQSPKNYTWEQLIDWIMEDPNAIVWHATEFTQL